jgi:hypothetical protein
MRQKKLTMDAHDHKDIDRDEPGDRNGERLPRLGAAGGDDCRCEEVSRMKPRQLLGLMLSDLAFWKKRDQDKPR